MIPLAHLSRRERALLRAIRGAGFRVNFLADCYTLTADNPIGPYCPWRFRSLQSVADYLIPIVHDPAFTDSVVAL